MINSNIDGNSGSGLGQAYKYGGVNPIHPLIITGSPTAIEI
jgi:hypothetical protein